MAARNESLNLELPTKLYSKLFKSLKDIKVIEFQFVTTIPLGSVFNCPSAVLYTRPHSKTKCHFSILHIHTLCKPRRVLVTLPNFESLYTTACDPLYKQFVWKQYRRWTERDYSVSARGMHFQRAIELSM